MPPTYADRSLAVLPAGCNGEFNLPPELTHVIARGSGAELWRADGARMLDMSMGWGSVLLGHANPAIVEAVRSRAPLGTNFAYVSLPALELAEEIVRLSPACDLLRFAASGTEATMYCMRLARAYSGKPSIMKFEGAYHGAHDVGVTSLFPDELYDFPTPLPSSAGTTAYRDGGVLVAPFNDIELTTELIEQNAGRLAAVIVEPLQRCLKPAPGFLEGLRAACDRYHVLLIFDEVVTGFRLAYGGAQEYYGVTPDLVAYGKALGGGLPIGVYGGRQEIMRLVCEDQMGEPDYVWTASTLGGNPLSAAAALATLSELRRPGVYERLHAMGKYLRSRLEDTLEEIGVVGSILGDGPLAQVAFVDHAPRDYRSSQHRDKPAARELMLELFRRGVFLNPMGTKLYLSAAHTREHCDELCEHFAAALQKVFLQPA